MSPDYGKHLKNVWIPLRIEALGERGALLGCGISESSLLIHVLENNLMGDFAENFCEKHRRIMKNIQQKFR